MRYANAYQITFLEKVILVGVNHIFVYLCAYIIIYYEENSLYLCSSLARSVLYGKAGLCRGAWYSCDFTTLV